MSMIRTISDELGLPIAEVELQILTNPIILGEPFDFFIKIRSGRKDLKIDSVDVGIFWWYLEKEFDPFKGRTEYVDKVPVLVHEYRREEPFEIPAHGARFFNVTGVPDPDFKYTHDRFGWFIKVHVDIPWAPDTRERFAVDVVPHLTISAPYAAMVTYLGFVEQKKWRKGDVNWCSFKLLPPELFMEFLDHVYLRVEDNHDGTVDIELEMELGLDESDRDNPVEDTRTVKRLIYYNKGEMIKPGGEVDLDGLAKRIRETLWMTINQFMEDPFLN